MITFSEIFKSLAEPTRLRLLLLLRNAFEFCVDDLMHALNMPQSTVSRHLAYLKRYNWLQDRLSGPRVYYSLKKEMDGFLQAQLVLIINQLANNPVCKADKQRLEAYLLTKDANVCN